MAGKAARLLVERSEEASVVVVGTRGLGGFSGLLLGSTSRAVLREAHSPVIVVRGRAERERQQRHEELSDSETPTTH